MHTRRVVLPLILAFCALRIFAQQTIVPTGTVDPAALQKISPRLISFTDTIDGQPDGALTVTFAIYDDQQATTALWTETQIVQITNGKYTALLGSTSADGLPETIFAADQAHWLSVQANGTEQRHLLVSVPYAMKAADTDRFGGLLPTDYVTVAQLQTILQNSAGAPAGSSPGGGTNGPTQTAATTGTAPQPATDFTDNNTSEVLLVTQQGTGYAIHAVTSGQAEAIFAENNALGGTGMHAFATAQSGQTTGLLAEVDSPDGISGVFVNRADGKILSLRNTSGEVVSVDQNGNINTTGSFSGNGSGLTNIPPGAIGATPGAVPNSVVFRDFSGSFSANQITGSLFSGDGSGLFNIPPGAIGATPSSVPNSVVFRDFSGSFSANQITASVFQGNGSGLFGIQPGAIGATPAAVPNSVVFRDYSGNFSANQITASLFQGNGSGLSGIPPGAIGATDANTPNSVVARDLNGSFSANQINANGLNLTGNADFSAASSTAPVKAVLSTNTPTTCQASKELLIKTDAPAGQQLFICNATGNGYVLVGDGTAAGVTGVAAGDGSVAIGGTAAQPTIAVASGGITSDKLAPNAVTAVSIADGSLSPAKITGTAATLGANTFTGTQTMPAVNTGSLTVSGNISGTGGGSISGSTFINTAAGTALSVFGGDATNPGFTATNPANGGIALEGTSLGNSAIGVLGRANGGQSVAGLFVNTQGNGRIISAGTGSGTFGSEVFSVDTAGNMFAGGALVASFPGSTANTTPSGLAKLDVNGFAVSTAPGDTTGAVGVVLPFGGSTSSVRIAYGGTAFCVFDSAPHIGDYVQISRTTTGECADVGPTFPASGQVIGRVTGVSFGAGGFVLLSGPSTQAVKSGVVTINTGAGLTGGPITSSGTISIANAGVTNTMLQNSSVAVNAGTGLSGGGLVSLGGSVTLNNAGALSFNGRTGNIFSASGDYSFAQLAGTATAAQLPADIAYNDRSNIFSTDQTIQGNLTATGNITASGSVTANSLSINDSGPANGFGPLSVVSQNNPAASLTSLGPIVFSAGNAVRGLMVLDSSGNLSLGGAVTATAYTGDGSGLSNVNASTIGGTSVNSLATTTALNAETAARQSADTMLQNNISAETSARQSDVANLQSSLATESSARAAGDASLQTSISAETAARQSDVANLQTNINNVSAADAKLASSNTFTAGTQDFSGAGATLPVRTVLSANTPATCVAGKELLIKTDAPAGQQLFICDGSGTTWNLVGDGASGGVTSFNGRAGSVTPAANDYSFAQISGSAAVAQLPSTVVYNNQANTLAGNQTVNGSVSATAFSGSGAGLSNVNAAALNGIPSSAFAQLNTANTFAAEQVLAASSASNASLNVPAGSAPASPMPGDIWNTGSTLQYRDSSSTTQSLVSTPQSGGFQLLKLTASITPTVVNAQICAEQSFSVAGVNTTDLLLGASQPATKSPGPNIAIGGWRVSAANTVAIQFCNVSRSNSTPTAGTYTFALMR